MHGTYLSLSAICMLTALCVADAQTIDRGGCSHSSNDFDAVIDSCTGLIKSGRETKANLATDFFVRGDDYKRKREYDRALEDFDEAIRLNPNFAAALISRGVVYGHKGQYDHACEDYNHAIRLNPNSELMAVAVNNRDFCRRHLSGATIIGQ
jgi:tetratricopeptide (TPR) repeat protein